MAIRPYSTKEDEIIREMHKKGFRTKDISVVLKSRTPDSIKERGYTLGLNWTLKPEIDFDAFTRMLKGAKQKCL